MVRLPRNPRRTALLRVVAFVCYIVAAQASAQTLLVGSDAACDFTTIQAAIDAAPPGQPRTIMIARNATYTAQALHIDSQRLLLIGGVADCTQTTPSGNTTISGLGGGHDSVLTITGDSSTVTLEHLTLTRGDEVFDGYGGGIDFRGGGVLTLRETTITQNYAGYGGGINVSATGGPAELHIEDGTVIRNNTAQFSGGGVRMWGKGDAFFSYLAHLIVVGDDVAIRDNEALGVNPSNNQPAYGYGGGVEIVAQAKASIGSPGVGNSGVIYGNRARYGGGIAVVGESGDSPQNAFLQLFATDPARPVLIYNNSASATGGGIFLAPDNLAPVKLCAYDFRIEGNRAQEGSGIYADQQDGDYTAEVGLNPQTVDFSGCDQRPLEHGAVACATNVPCDTIAGNRAETANGTPTTGAALLIQRGAALRAGRLRLLDNVGGQALRLTHDDFDGYNGHIENCVIGGNTVSGHLVLADDGADLTMVDCTIANNTIAAPHVLEMDGDFILRRAILWQPGKTSLTQTGGARIVENVITSDRLSLDGGNGTTVIESDPRLIDPAGGDYRLRAASPAVDFAPIVDGNDYDADLELRDTDMPIHFDRNGVRDLGAFERQLVSPLTLNSDFDVNDRHWTELTAGISARDPAQNVSGPVGSGAMSFVWTNVDQLPNPRVSSRMQCIHLPGPGYYGLSGYGRTTGSIAIAQQGTLLHWEFRSNGGESCTAGAPTRQGDHLLGTGTGWAHPNYSPITIQPGEWTSNSSVSITMVMRFSGALAPMSLKGWFDGVSLDASITPIDVLLADGFE